MVRRSTSHEVHATIQDLNPQTRRVKATRRAPCQGTLSWDRLVTTTLLKQSNLQGRTQPHH